jgi:hydrogenase expression/formation protein HypC
MCLALPGKIVSLTDSGELTRAGRVSFGGIVKEINLVFVPDAVVGDYILAHVGVAIAKLSEAEAVRTLEELGGRANEVS